MSPIYTYFQYYKKTKSSLRYKEKAMVQKTPEKDHEERNDE